MNWLTRRSGIIKGKLVKKDKHACMAVVGIDKSEEKSEQKF